MTDSRYQILNKIQMQGYQIDPQNERKNGPFVLKNHFHNKWLL